MFRYSTRAGLASLAVAAGLGLAACSTLPTDTDPVAVAATTTAAPTTTRPAPPAPRPVPASRWTTDEQVLIAYLDAKGIAYGSEATVIDTGHKACAAIDSGMSVAAIAATAIREGIAPRTAGTLVGAWVATLCPQHTDALEAFVATYGN